MSEHRPSRISSPEDVARKLLPLRRAEKLEDFFLYWIPVGANPVPSVQRTWLNAFFDRLSDYLIEKVSLRAEVFLQYKTVYPNLMDPFLDHAMDFVPIAGFGRKPGVPLPPIPTIEDLQPVIDGKKPYNFGDYIGDFCYWFLGKDERKQRQVFLGEGGMTILFLPPDPGAIAQKMPIQPRLREHPTFRPLFEKFDPDQVVKRGQSLKDNWLKKSMEIYADELPKSTQMKGVQFVVPLLKASNFLNEPKERERLSGLCEFYINESVEDGGILLASPKDHQDSLIEILEDMRKVDMKYPER